MAIPRYEHTLIGFVTGGVGAVLTVLFSTLTVVAGEDELRFDFGLGFWTRRVSLKDIRRVETVRNRALHGWGIHGTSHEWPYNVSGQRAVELEGGGEGQIRVGADEPETLKAVVEEALPAG